MALATTVAMSTYKKLWGKSMVCLALTSLTLRSEKTPASELQHEFELGSSSSIHLPKSARKSSSVVIYKYPDLCAGCSERTGISILNNSHASNTRGKEFIPVLRLHNA